MAGPRSDAPTDAWFTSGLASLSGPPPGGRLGPPARLVDGVRARGDEIERVAGRWGHRLDVDWLALTTVRAHLEGLTAGGRTSCGGATRLLECADGWVAVSLARSSDLELLPAWLALGGDPTPWRSDDETWCALAARVRRLAGSALTNAAEVVGLAVGGLGERTPGADGGTTLHDVGPAAHAGPPARVLDLGTLWAAPLCASLLGRCGGEVLKVSSRNRPDGSARGNAAFENSLNGRKARLELDLGTRAGRAELDRLVRNADVVVESARPRGLEQMGIVAAEVMARGDGPRAWVSITGHGRASGRVAFGDDAAVAGGLVVHDAEGPWFCGDALADPLSGIAAGAAALRCLSAGRRTLVEVSMSAVAAAHAGPTRPVGSGR
ncbi:MAG: CoA transferase [Microthrixaceae bacterium]